MTRNRRGGRSSSTPSRGSMASTRRATRSPRCARTSTCSAGGGGGRRLRSKFSVEGITGPTQAAGRRMMAEPEEYDLVVLGSGEAGKYLAWTLAAEGKRTAVIERKYLG